MNFDHTDVPSSQVPSSSTPRILPFCKETISDPISPCGQHERRAHAKEILCWGSSGVEILSTQEDMFDQTSMTGENGLCTSTVRLSSALCGHGSSMAECSPPSPGPGGSAQPLKPLANLYQGWW